MMDAEGAAAGLIAAQRLARFEGIEFRDGLSDPEFARIEQRFNFEFADDHRAFLAAGLPVWAAGHDDDPSKASWGWPNWRDLESDDLRQQVNWPVDCIHHHIAKGGWPHGWGKRPKTPDAVMIKTQRLLAKVPRLIPVYAHRYLPAGSGTNGHPVLSVHSLNDIMVYGVNLEDYLVQEFHETEVSVAFWREHL
jgi:hypothetical protein